MKVGTIDGNFRARFDHRLWQADQTTRSATCGGLATTGKPGGDQMRALMGSARLLVMGLAVVALSAAPVAQASGGTDTGGSSSTSGGGTGGGQTLPSTGAAPCATVTYSLSTS